jgi:hypothetical protein
LVPQKESFQKTSKAMQTNYKHVLLQHQNDNQDMNSWNFSKASKKTLEEVVAKKLQSKHEQWVQTCKDNLHLPILSCV